MSRSPTTAYEQANDASHFEEVIFAELQLASGTVRVCTREHDVDWDGFTWLGKGRVGTIEAVQEAGQLEPLGIAMTLAVSSELLAEALTPSEYKNRNVKIWRGLMVAEQYLSLPGSSGNYASTPDSAAISITGDIDVRFKIAMDDWTPSDRQGIARHWEAFGNQRGWDFSITNITGRPSFVSTADGFTQRAAFATAAPVVADGDAIWLRVTRASASGTVTFYTSADGVTWTQLGSAVATTAGGIFDSAGDLKLGVSGSGGDFQMVGKVYYAEVRDGIDGPVVASADFSRVERGATSFGDAQGNTWTVNQSGTPKAEVVAPDISIVADPVGPFTFRMDKLEFQLGEIGLLKLTAESRLADWQRPRVRRYNDADQQALHPRDNFFANAEEMVNKQFVW